MVMEIALSKAEIKEYERLKTISQFTPIKKKIKFFEKIYSCSFEDFEKKAEKGEMRASRCGTTT